jgi:hypothetical protein
VRRFLQARLVVPVGLATVIVLVFGLYWFQPWKLFTHSHVDEALPGYSVSTAPGSSGTPSTASEPAPSQPPVPRPSPPTATVLSRSGFTAGEHATTGTALLIRLADGRQVVRLEGFDTSDGPDVRVILASTDSGSTSVGDYVQLGHLKATSGNQNYYLAAGTDVGKYRSIVIWCKRFNAVFGSAPLRLG